jgi:hypothetical protein
MTLKKLSLKQSLNDAYRLIKPERADIEKFKSNFKLLLSHINPKESEENMKGLMMDFLKNTYYNPNYHIVTKGRTDFVIHTGKDATHPAGVLFEAKKPSNPEMVTLSNLNTKAMHEIILYYLRERIEHHNNDIKYIVITNIYEWFMFDAPVFEKLFFKNNTLVKEYKTWMAKQKVSANNDLFYNEIAKSFLASLTEEIEFTWFDIREFEKPLLDNDKKNDSKLIPLFKVLSPTHLLKLPFANDSNSLNKSFYSELLYLIGLEEVKEGSKKIIRRKQEGKRNDGSLLENTIIILETENCLHKVSGLQQYGDTKDEQLFSVALELCITWINRILFLKLLEAQLLKYHKGNSGYRFLNYKLIPQYDELYKLFFQVLAKKNEERIAKVKEKYNHIPYLNSSLFEITTLEDQTIRINMLDDAAELALPGNTILKDDHNKPIAEKLNTLQYIFKFLNAYDFASEGSEEIQEERKTLINASVLGLIFEKINGYKDGSIFTPGFITMYMCRQSIRQAVLNKFKEKYSWKADAFEDLHNYVADDRSNKSIKQHNALINSLTICDPAVGSGHFLVSALNEMIAIKSELGILADENGKRLSDYTATVENDDLIIKNKEGNFFTYDIHTINGKLSIPNEEMQRVQTTLFHEKQTIIENCLFGVDINPKSVQICRLRLWIELLKNAYYIASSPLPARAGTDGERAGGEVFELQTLPNIDINIKTGNSLISRFALNEDLKSVFKQGKYSVETYKIVVQTYKDSKSKDEKAELQKFVNELKEQFKTVVYRKDPLRNKIQQLRGDVLLLTTANIDLFGKKKTDSEVKDEVRRLEISIAQKEKELEEKENSKIYHNAFEWRFEFPEVLDMEGNFIGFDVIIGNPPYIGEKELSFFFNNIKKIPEWFNFYRRRTNIYYFFMKRSNEILSSNGLLSLIIPREFLTADWANKLRGYLLNNLIISSITDFDTNLVFEDAGTSSLIFNTIKKLKEEYKFDYFISTDEKKKLKELDIENRFKKFKINVSSLDHTGISPWTFNQKLIIGDKLTKLGNLFSVTQGLVTGADKVTPKHISTYLVPKKMLNRGIFVLSEGIDIRHKDNEIYLMVNNNWELLPFDEHQFIKPFVYSTNIKKWVVSNSDDYLIFFGQKTIIPNIIIEYLKQFINILINRATVVDEIITENQFLNFTKEEIKQKFSSAGTVQKIMRSKKWFLPLYGEMILTLTI